MDKDCLSDILASYAEIQHQDEQLNQEVAAINDKIDRRIKICDKTTQILDNATTEFNGLTSILNKKDIPFFVFSVLLQCSVKYCIKALREMSDKELAQKTPFHHEEKSNRQSNIYYASREEIISNPVPFDAIQKEHSNKWYIDNNQIAPGFSGFNHRATALGHDPLLGLVIGTANIMTSTITRNDFVSWHINTMPHSRTAKNGREYFAYLDTVCSRADTLEIFRSIANRIQQEGKEGWITLGTALLKEIVHLFSDLPSKQGLPLPVVSTFSPKLARTLSLYGFNASTITQGSIATMFINWLIGFLHRLCKSESEDEKLYMVRTKKIIMYSDTFSTVSDIGYSMFTAYMGDKNTMRKFDLGGYLVTLYQICHSSNIISEIERDFYTKRIIEEFERIE
ncbi:MAG: hypothetical protein SO001_07950 [Alloprevotella sp.]|nr:hypothetical protein [Alloprevotella sp.]